MPAWIPAAITAAAGLFGAERTNKVNQAEAAKNRAFNAGEAEKNRSFQERMRNTAYQAAIADMEAAGLNPALAYSQGPAASPGGSMASGSMPAPAENSVSSALQALQMRKSLQLLDAQIKKTRTEEAREYQGLRTERWRSNYLLGIQGDSRRQPIMELLEAEIGSARAGATNMAAVADRNRALARIAGPMADLSDDWGRLLPLFQLFMNPAGRAVNSLFKRR